MTTHSTFQDLRIWQEAMDLTVEIYRVTGGFPRNETYGLASQMRRAAVSVPSNIAEGKGHRGSRVCALPSSCQGITLGATDSAFDSSAVTILVREKGG